MVMKYPKIQTLWKRDIANKNIIIPGSYSKPEFDNIKRWLITEKIDGTNVRVSCVNGEIKIDGKTDEAQIPATLYNVVAKLFPLSMFEKVFSFTAPKEVILFGEGIGPKITPAGKFYCDDPDFVLFDVYVDGWWLEYLDVMDVAHKFGIKIAPAFGTMDIFQAIKLVKTSPHSSFISKYPKAIEGIVARSYPQMLFRNEDKDPIMWKLKVKDYESLKRSEDLKQIEA